MVSFKLLLGFAALSSIAVAQVNETCCTVQPNSVDADDRIGWCRAQTNTCPQICGGHYSANRCDSRTLDFECVCMNGNTPNISSFDQTLPSLECLEWKRQCISSHPNDLPGQNYCLSFQCGDRNATALASASSSASSGGSSSTASPTSSPTGEASPTDSPAPAETSNAAVALSMAQQYGTGMIAAGFFALFGLAL
ncbi:hypothetical protein K402DRAFT_413778 [Aulographum hederae CBS 113979]|uniref:DUF7707 domain-containing protein n=1 Tax=Aulographum hederae CBS 113979 TaxID=1176131 RepID=A0A6G1GUR8_9PEZI|nr:hypothetical protein K402DRAFT_413778 [Aulographum hederae CBS 113979]